MLGNGIAGDAGRVCCLYKNMKGAELLCCGLGAVGSRSNDNLPIP